MWARGRPHLLRDRPLGPPEPRLDEARRQRREAPDDVRRLRRPLAVDGRRQDRLPAQDGPLDLRPRHAARTSRSRSSSRATACRCASASSIPRPTSRAWALSKDGERIVLETRGDLFVTRTKKKGLIRRITESSLARTQVPGVLARRQDDRRLDRGGRRGAARSCYAADNGAPPQAARQRRRPAGTSAPAWSPDGKKLAWGDEKYRLYVTDVGDRRDHRGRHAATGRSRSYAWSPDSRYLAYAVAAGRTASARSGSGTARTKKRHDAERPDVQLLLARLGSRRGSTSTSSPTATSIRTSTASRRASSSTRRRCPCVRRAAGGRHAAVRARAATPIPQAGREEEGRKTRRRPTRRRKDGRQGRRTKEKAKRSRSRSGSTSTGSPTASSQVPVAPGNYDGLRAVDGKLHWLEVREPRHDAARATTRTTRTPRGDLQTYDIEKEKVSTLAARRPRLRRLAATARCSSIQTKDGFVRVEAGATSAPEGRAERSDGRRSTSSGWSIRVNPRDEWKQMLHEAWRLQRDFFYDPKMHGVDWDARLEAVRPARRPHRLARRPRGPARRDARRAERRPRLPLAAATSGAASRSGRASSARTSTTTPASGFWQIQKIYRGDYPDPRTGARRWRGRTCSVKPGSGSWRSTAGRS